MASSMTPHVIFVTQAIDPRHPVLGGIAPAVSKLSRLVDLTVIANEVRDVPASFEGKVVSLGKESGTGRSARTLNLLRAAAQEIRPRRSFVLVHMVPAYLNLIAPIAKARKARLGLWYAHPSATPKLRLANALADVVLTSLPGAYPLRHRALHLIGQAVDTENFVVEPEGPLEPLRALALGRTTRKKNFHTIIKAVDLAVEDGLAITLDVVGPSMSDAERTYRDELHVQIETTSTPDAFEIRDGVHFSEIGQLLRSHHVLINTTEAGSGDKTVFEALASGRPVVTSNPSFSAVLEGLPLGGLVQPGDPEEIAAALAALAAAPSDAWESHREQARAVIESSHSIDTWAAGIHKVAAGE